LRGFLKQQREPVGVSGHGLAAGFVAQLIVRFEKDVGLTGSHALLSLLQRSLWAISPSV
jgi:hypothetical protein